MRNNERQWAMRGFTAVEISMVMTVIAILALLVIPVFRERVDSARRAAAQDEMLTLIKAETLAFADTGYWYRLQDLDNTKLYTDRPIRTDEEVPIASWNRPFSIEERRRLTYPPRTWQGPYVSMNNFKYMTLQNAVTALPEFFWSAPGRGGPIMDLQPTVGWLDASGMQDHPDDKVILDPWGTPYLFFGPGRLMEEDGIYVTVESYFGDAAIYSLGPDGLPGPSISYTNAPTTLLRERGIIGTGTNENDRDFIMTFH
ncbi:prepilin-type N-terminal cleavage/methylation domain-containing protein [Candidatus Sumerlaeota bacterium]|nr:prepilin-type N-terminal cleavage/methylation domain-containing protein [Candidatus Sumerlaeota bacterium]